MEIEFGHLYVHVHSSHLYAYLYVSQCVFFQDVYAYVFVYLYEYRYMHTTCKLLKSAVSLKVKHI